MTAARFLPVVIAACLGLLLAAGPLAAQSDPDRITSFRSDIVIEASGDLLVTEEIDFLVTPGSQKHGIYRDFPTTYRNALGITQKVGFDVLEVSRNDRAEPFILIHGPAGQRLRIGDADVLVGRGLQRYRIVYRSDRQLLFLAEADELYWNVTGNDWAHTIDRAEATVHLPGGARPLDVAAYTGAAGEVGESFTQSRAGDGSLAFATTRALRPGEGLTIAVSWPKGIVAAPGADERFANLLRDNLGLLVGLAGLALTLAYFLWQWHRVGRDPQAGVIVPLFEAPKGLSPAATGYVWAKARGTSLDRVLAFTVALTSLAIKGLLTITERNGGFALRKSSDAARDKLPPGELSVMQSLFPRGVMTVEIERTYSKAIDQAIDRLLANLAREHDGAYFRDNFGFWLSGAPLALASAAAALVIQYGDPFFLGFVAIGAIFAIGFSLPVLHMLRSLWPNWVALLRGRPRQVAQTVAGTALALPFCIPPLGALFLVYDNFGPLMLLLVGALLFTVLLFWLLMKAPTLLGRKMLDEIQGYRLYLSVAEADRMNMLTAEPEMTLDLFEHHLPYAMALGVEEEWSERFTAGAAAAARQAVEHQSRWYRGRQSYRSLTAASAGLAAGLSSTLSSAATPPSSSSSGGSSGGGSSGGGGGGGGGGSW